MDPSHVGIIGALVEQDPSVVDGRLEVAEEPHGAEVLALVISSADGGESGESVSVVFSHEYSILQIGPQEQGYWASASTDSGVRGMGVGDGEVVSVHLGDDLLGALLGSSDPLNLSGASAVAGFQVEVEVVSHWV